MKTANQQRQIPALYMRGGTSKGVFLDPRELPADPKERDAVLLRLMGSPDPYRQQLDGMGGATSSTSKVVLVSRSQRPDCDVEYVFGQVSIDRQLVDWSGNCGNLTSAVGPYAIHRGLVTPPPNGVATIRLWQAGIRKKIVAHVPMQDGQLVEMGDFELDGVAFPAAEIRLDFIDPGADESDTESGDEGAASGGGAGLFPTGRRIDTLSVPGVGDVDATLINAGNPAVFIRAQALGLGGTELPADINARPELLERCEAIRSHAAVAMGLAPSADFAREHRQHTPKLAFASAPQSYTATSGRPVAAEDIDLTLRIVSMGRLHHAMTGTGAVAIAAASAIPGTLLSDILGGPRDGLRFGHPAGMLKVGAEVRCDNASWVVSQVSMSRSARRLMDGMVFVPA
ncbi:2-methylaconitate cis-trans isomerase PrpF [Parapusillimonas sp. SGNA-6]|nr:2-methylaconitate cis-trans isomerase PrpF [Parapusillimonas sp. SGNA-6]